MELTFRNLRADEIECRIQQVKKSQKGTKFVQLLLYKDARCDQNILDETVGPMNWKKAYLRDNANCIISIWDDDKKEWISKEDTGVESNTEKQKGLASDSQKRAAFAWGIGRALYTSPAIFFFDKEANIYEKDGKVSCYDSFEVESITYTADGKIIDSVVIKDTKTGTSKTFKNDLSRYGVSPSTNSTCAKTSGTKLESSKTTNTNAAPAPKPKSQAKKVLFSDDEVILIGNCRKMTYGEAKETDMWQQYLSYVKAHPDVCQCFPDEARQEQGKRILELVA